MIKKSLQIFTFMILILLFLFNTTVFAGSADGKNTTTDVKNNTQASTSWVSDAFSATRDFFSEGEVTDKIGVFEPWMVVFSDIVRAVNRVLTVLLAGLSIISLTIVGIKYLMTPYDSKKKSEAKESLHTVFHGMLYGFGAFAIWRIVMSIVRIVIYCF